MVNAAGQVEAVEGVRCDLEKWKVDYDHGDLMVRRWKVQNDQKIVRIFEVADRLG